MEATMNSEQELKEEDLWLRPAGDKEEYFEVGHTLGFFQTHYSLSLCSTTPLDHSLLTTVLTHLYWKVPVLRVCLGRRRGQLWLKKMRRCILDLKVLTEGGMEEERDRLMTYTFNTVEGPMWCVRVGQQQARGSHHQYLLMLGIHHTIADGFTNIRVCHMLHKILDDILIGRPVDDKEQLGQHVDGHLAQQLYEEEKEKLLQNPEFLSERRDQLLEAAKTHPHLLDLLSSPRDENGRNHYVFLDLNENITKSFINKCKCEGVSFHSGLAGVVNAAIVRLLEDAGKGQPQYNFAATHDLSMRRYYPGDTSQVLGTHLPLFSFLFPFKVSKDFESTFWPRVKSFHQDFHLELRAKAPVQAVALRLMQKSKSENYAEYFRTTGSPNYYYAVSNLGDVTSLLPGEGEMVQVEGLTRISTVRANATIMCFFVHTYKGICRISLVYSSRYMDHHVARELLDLMKSTFSAVCNM